MICPLTVILIASMTAPEKPKNRLFATKNEARCDDTRQETQRHGSCRESSRPSEFSRPLRTPTHLLPYVPSPLETRALAPLQNMRRSGFGAEAAVRATHNGAARSCR
ncbi:hypothetical protein MRB53_038178 [Persea americana]|nr:hypothetical protein MRB53_038178 [Persea americana]